MTDRVPEIAIIGYGRFGRFAAGHLKKHFRVYVADRKDRLRTESGITKISIEEAASKKNIVLTVSINQLPSVLEFLAPRLRMGSLVCDTSSVKEQPIRWMKRYLPTHVSILGTHPLFGPDSPSKGLAGNTIVLCPVRISKAKLSKIHRHLGRQGLRVHRMMPRRHDRLMASTLFLTQFLGRGLIRSEIRDTEIATENFRRLAGIAEAARHDSMELFRDMYRFNRYARKIPNRLISELHQLTTFLCRSPK